MVFTIKRLYPNHRQMLESTRIDNSTKRVHKFQSSVLLREELRSNLGGRRAGGRPVHTLSPRPPPGPEPWGSPIALNAQLSVCLAWRTIIKLIGGLRGFESSFKRMPYHACRKRVRIINPYSKPYKLRRGKQTYNNWVGGVRLVLSFH